MPKILKNLSEVEREKKRQQDRYDWIQNLSKVFDKSIVYKYFEANSGDKEYIKRLKETGNYEHEAMRWWIGNMFATMEVGAYDEQNFTVEKYIEFKENVELPRIKELRLGTLNTIERKLIKDHPDMYQQLVDSFGLDFSKSEYIGNIGSNKTRLLVPSVMGGALVLIYDWSNNTFEVHGDFY